MPDDGAVLLPDGGGADRCGDGQKGQELTDVHTVGGFGVFQKGKKKKRKRGKDWFGIGCEPKRQVGKLLSSMGIKKRYLLNVQDGGRICFWVQVLARSGTD